VTQNNQLLNIIKTTDDTKFSNDIKKSFSRSRLLLTSLWLGTQLFFFVEEAQLLT